MKEQIKLEKNNNCLSDHSTFLFSRRSFTCCWWNLFMLSGLQILLSQWLNFSVVLNCIKYLVWIHPPLKYPLATGFLGVLMDVVYPVEILQKILILNFYSILIPSALWLFISFPLVDCELFEDATPFFFLAVHLSPRLTTVPGQHLERIRHQGYVCNKRI